MGGITDALTRNGSVIMILKFQVLVSSKLKYSTQEQIGFIFKQSKKYVNSHHLNNIFQFFEKPIQILKLSFISQICKQDFNNSHEDTF